jgi:Asp-tRNA(Asn)/Glu-tRNA(Gln) amidotransferase C subunit
MWNRDYEEAINEACKVWTAIMSITNPELIFAKTKVLQIMIECTLNVVMSNTSDAEGWLDTLKSLDYNGIMTAILDIKTMIRKDVEKEFISKQFIETVKRIGIIEDSIERND